MVVKLIFYYNENLGFNYQQNSTLQQNKPRSKQRIWRTTHTHLHIMYICCYTSHFTTQQPRWHHCERCTWWLRAMIASAAQGCTVLIVIDSCSFQALQNSSKCFDRGFVFNKKDVHLLWYIIINDDFFNFFVVNDEKTSVACLSWIQQKTWSYLKTAARRILSLIIRNNR